MPSDSVTILVLKKTIYVHNILITGATGQVGTAVVEHLLVGPLAKSTVAALRPGTENQTKANAARILDFEDPSTFEAACTDITILFLLRPPHISAVEKYFRPLLTTARDCGVEKVVFLSVQGADKSSVIPHYKIEQLIKEFGFAYIFVRPGYFMQNLTTTHRPSIAEKDQIVLPAGEAAFTWVDVENVGEASAKLLENFDAHCNTNIDVTGTEQKSFSEVANTLTEELGRKISYRSINPISYYFMKRKSGMDKSFALVVTLLHFLPRLQKPGPLSNAYQDLTGKTPTTIKEFVLRERAALSPRS